MAGSKGSHQLTVKSNDGLSVLDKNVLSDGSFGVTGTVETLQVTSAGLRCDNRFIFLYVGMHTFKGFATSPNATEPTYPVGSTFTFGTPGATTDETLTLYLVEGGLVFDLSTLDLSAGTHKITVKARASGYADSPASDAVSYVVAGEETYTVSGTWYFNDAPAALKSAQSINFTSNGEYFYGMRGVDGGYLNLGYINAVDIPDRNYMLVFSSPFEAPSNKGWEDEAYRYVRFDGEQTVRKEFYEWLDANAEQIEDPLHNTTWLLNNTFSTKAYSDVKDNSLYDTVHGFPSYLFICDGVAYEGGSSSGSYPNYYTKSNYKIYNIKSGTHTTGFGYYAITDDGMGERISASYNGSWTSQAYRTITSKMRITNVGGYLSYKLLMANATEIETPAPTEIEFTVDGKLYKGETNMTFYEWCNSSYNTIGCTTKDYYGSLIFLGTKRLYSETMSERGVTSGVVVSAGEAYVFEEDRNPPDN